MRSIGQSRRSIIWLANTFSSIDSRARGAGVGAESAAD